MRFEETRAPVPIEEAEGARVRKEANECRPGSPPLTDSLSPERCRHCELPP